MGGLLTQKTLILAKLESTYGTDPSPVPASDAIEVFDFTPRINKEDVVRNPLRTSLSPLPLRYSLKNQEFQFETELKGGGSVGVAPAIGKLLKACGMVETVSVGSSVTYLPGNPVSSITIYAYKDGLLFKLTGGYGTFELTAEAGKLPRIRWTVRGLWNLVTDVATPAGEVFESTIAAVLESTQTQIAGYVSGIIRNYSFDIGNEIALRPSLNSAGAVVGTRIASRNPKGRMSMEAELRATVDVWNQFDTAGLVTFQSIIGTVAGNICTIAGTSKAQITAIEPADDNGIFMQNLDLAFSGSDDEISFKFT